MQLGVFQIAGGGLTPDERLAALEDRIRAQHLDLVLCPELFLSGYHVGTDHKHLAEPVGGPFAEKVAELARLHDTVFVYGYPESAGGVIYNAAVLIGSDGEILANHRKRLASPNSFEETTFANGNSPTLVDYAGFRMAIIICYEVELPESLRIAGHRGADLVLVPTALVSQWSIVAEKVVPTRAFENGIWLAYANHAGEENGFTYLGGSRIVAPDGEEVAVAGPDQSLISARIDLERVSSARSRLPYLRDAKKIV